MFKITYTLLLVACSVSVSQSAHAATWGGTPTEDTYISAGTNAATNYGSNISLRTRWSTSLDNTKSFLRFALPTDLGVGATIHSATLTISAENETTNNTKRIQVAGLAESFDNWSESTLTYDSSDTDAGVDNSVTATAPGFQPGAITDPFLSGDANGVAWATDTERQTFSLLGNGSAFQDFVFADTNDTITLILLPVSTSTYQSDESLFANRPWLEIDYTPAAIPEPGSLVLIGLGALMIRGRSRRPIKGHYRVA